MAKMDPINAQMQAVLDQFAQLGGTPIEQCTPDEARRQPSRRQGSQGADRITRADRQPEPVANAQVDQLRNDGEKRGKALRDAGNDLAHRHCEGVTHKFFGKAAVVDGARDAQALAAQRLRAAVAR